MIVSPAAQRIVILLVAALVVLAPIPQNEEAVQMTPAETWEAYVLYGYSPDDLIRDSIGTGRDIDDLCTEMAHGLREGYPDLTDDEIDDIASLFIKRVEYEQITANAIT